MNRLILIGNGFDLAHGLQTSYKDFIYGYLRKAYERAYLDHKYQDDFIIIQRDLRYPDFPRGISGYLDKYFENDTQKLIKNQPLYEGRGDPAIFSIQFISTFFNRIVTNCINANWVDIENEFYQELKKILKSTNNSWKQSQLSELNNSLNGIIIELEKYLNNIGDSQYNRAYSNIIEKAFLDDDFSFENTYQGQTPDKTLLLNFNYTKTAEKYLKSKVSPTNYEINYIHGEVNAERNPIIFGFGDELDEDYLKMELENTKGFFTHIKSFGYFQTLNYHNLIRFIDSDDFQVFILGHSCGLSDRTMLNMIFEHQNCKSIRIYYHAYDGYKNNYRALTEEISRHFKNKAEMRRRIVPFNISQVMPQFGG